MKKSLDDEIQLFVKEVKKTIPNLDGSYQIRVRLADDSFNIVRFDTAEKAAIFLASFVVLKSSDFVSAYV